jgi:erythromycin esterase-like protein
VRGAAGNSRSYRDKTMTDAVDAARERIGRAIFATWDERDVEELVRLMRKFADTVTGDAPGDPSKKSKR